MSRKAKVSKLIFETEASKPKDAFVLVFDLEGFSNFFSQPDVQDYVAKFLNRIFECISTAIYGGVSKFLRHKKPVLMDPFLEPSHVKFLGDGALYIWTFDRGQKEENKAGTLALIHRLWNMRVHYSEITKEASEDVPVVDLPKNIRFGFASGTVYRIIHKNTGDSEYIGYCINLASRLQSYCRSLGFIASARIVFSDKTLKKYGWYKVVAKKLSGFPSEIVIVDKEEYEKLDDKIKKELFDEIS